NTDGTPPQAGIDIEPNQYQTVEGITIDSCYFEGNTGSGVEVAAYHTDSYVKGIYVANSTFIDNVILLTTDDGGDGLLSDVTILSNIFQITTRDRAIRINYNPSNVVIDSCKMVATSQEDGAANGFIIEGATGPVTITNCHIN